VRQPDCGRSRCRRALPAWLRYVPISKTFVAYGVPANALPIEVLVRIGEQSWIVVITRPETR
jgi:hypothetical protein